MTQQPTTPPFLPSTPGAWIVTALGLGALAVSVLMQLPMWQVMLGLKPVAAGGGEFLIAMLFGLPSLAVAGLLLATALLVRSWRSMVAWLGIPLVCIPLLIWIVAVVLDATR